MLDGGHFHITPMQGRPHHRVTDILGVRFDIYRLIQIRTPEDDTRVRQRRPQGHEHLLSGVQSDPCGTNRILQCSLIQH